MNACALENALAEWILSVLSQGIHLDARTLACMESTFGTRDPAVLLADAESGEAASFLELLFTPEPAVQRAYESRWGCCLFSETGARTVEKILACRSASSVLHIPGRKDPMHLEVPPFALAAFVQRLKISWQPCQALADALEKYPDDEQRAQVRAILRHTRVAWQPHHVEIIDLFLAHIPAAAHGFEEDLTFLCTLLDEFKPGQAPFDFLMVKKHFYFQALCKAQAFEQRLRAGNMEILMLQGARAAYGNIEQWRAWMRQVDRISMALFASTRYFQEPLTVGLNWDE